MIDKRYQVFISSTFEDLKVERRAVTEQILNLGHLPVGMELFHAANEDQWSYIRRRIAQCDYYVVILAERYGSVDKEGMSYTEKEYRYAIEKKIPVAAFLLSDQVRQDRPAKFVEHSKIKKIDSFRLLCKGKMVKLWSNPNELSLAVTNSLSGLFEIHPRPGLVPGNQMPPEEALRSITSITEENQKLRRKIEKLQEVISQKEFHDKLDVMRADLKSITLSEFAESHGFSWFENAPSNKKNEDGININKANVEITILDFINAIYSKPITKFNQVSVPIIIKEKFKLEIHAGISKAHSVSGWFESLSSCSKLGLLSDNIEVIQNTVFGKLSSTRVTWFRFTELGNALLKSSKSPKDVILGSTFTE